MFGAAHDAGAAISGAMNEELRGSLEMGVSRDA